MPACFRGIAFRKCNHIAVARDIFLNDDRIAAGWERGPSKDAHGFTSANLF